MKYRFQTFTRVIVCMLFFLNAQINIAQIIQETKPENGVVETRSDVHDSTVLHPDKDNHLCLYGMRNAANEWVIPPQYENVEVIHSGYKHLENYYIVTQNEKSGVISERGKMLIPIEWDALHQLSQEMPFNETTKRPLSTPQIWLRAVKNKQMGVIDLQNNLILKPNYTFIDRCKKDLFIIRNHDKYGIVDKNGLIVIQPTDYKLEFTAFDDVFMTLGPDFVDDYTQKTLRKHGLMHRSGQVLVPTQFLELKSRGNSYYSMHEYTWEENAGRGLFHVDKGWMLDTTIRILPFNGNEQIPNYLLSQKAWVTREPYNAIVRYGVFSEIDHQMLLDFEYESIQCFQTPKYNPNATRIVSNDVVPKQPYFLCQKKGLYGIFDPIQRVWMLPMAYEGLQPFGDSLFMVLKQGKWRCINTQGQFAMTDLFDELIVDRQRSPLVTTQFYAQKNGRLYGFDSRKFPSSSPLYDYMQHYINTRLFITWQGDTIVTDTDKNVIVSTQESIISKDNDFFIVENKATKMRQIVDYQGNRKPFASKYKVQNIQGQENVLLVLDTTTNLLGATTLDGKEILPCQFWGMTAADRHERIWVKKEGIRLKPITFDLNQLKNQLKMERKQESRFKGCQMYDKKGQLLSPLLFDYPIEWQKNLKVGIGQIADQYGLWNAQGKMILPPQYDRIIYDEFSKMYYLFQAKNSKEMALNFANEEGQIVINTFFKNMSLFYGDYALVETDAGYGMIQKNGQYWITPAQFALQQSDKSILDTLMTHAQLDFTMPFESDNEGAVALKQWQALKSAGKQIQVGNLIVEQLIQQYFLNKDLFKDQSSHRIFILNQEASSFVEHSNPNYVQETLTIPMMRFTDKASHFLLETALSQPHSQYGRQPYKRYLFFKNFKIANNVWKESILSDILIWNEETFKGLNALLIQKIGALQNTPIDCNNPEKYWEIVQNRFFILPEGLTFYFPKSGSSELSYEENIPILMTWAELKQQFAKLPKSILY